jgi:hypothetical protein
VDRPCGGAQPSRPGGGQSGPTQPQQQRAGSAARVPATAAGLLTRSLPPPAASWGPACLLNTSPGSGRRSGRTPGCTDRPRDRHPASSQPIPTPAARTQLSHSSPGTTGHRSPPLSLGARARSGADCVVVIVALSLPTSTASDTRLAAAASPHRGALLPLLPQLQVAHKSYPAARLHGWTQPVVLRQPPPSPQGYTGRGSHARRRGEGGARCLLPAACCLLPAACCLLPAACCLLPAAGGRHARRVWRGGALQLVRPAHPGQQVAAASAASAGRSSVSSRKQQQEQQQQAAEAIVRSQSHSFSAALNKFRSIRFFSAAHGSPPHARPIWPPSRSQQPPLAPPRPAPRPRCLSRDFSFRHAHPGLAPRSIPRPAQWTPAMDRPSCHFAGPPLAHLPATLSLGLGLLHPRAALLPHPDPQQQQQQQQCDDGSKKVCKPRPDPPAARAPPPESRVSPRVPPRRRASRTR